MPCRTSRELTVALRPDLYAISRRGVSPVRGNGPPEAAAYSPLVSPNPVSQLRDREFKMYFAGCWLRPQWAIVRNAALSGAQIELLSRANIAHRQFVPFPARFISSPTLPS